MLESVSRLLTDGETQTESTRFPGLRIHEFKVQEGHSGQNTQSRVPERGELHRELYRSVEGFAPGLDC